MTRCAPCLTLLRLIFSALVGCGFSISGGKLIWLQRILRLENLIEDVSATSWLSQFMAERIMCFMIQQEFILKYINNICWVGRVGLKFPWARAGLGRAQTTW